MQQQEDTADLLAILEAHGRHFLDSFITPKPVSRKRKRTDNISDIGPLPRATFAEDSEEEWGGILQEADWDDEWSRLDHEDDEGFRPDDDGLKGEASSVESNVIVFRDVSHNSKTFIAGSKAQMKAFMSSKVSKLHQGISGPEHLKNTGENSEEERSNAQNDAILHRLVHTKLLSSSLDPDLDLTPAHRRKALAGRILELSGVAKLGKGEKSVREKEINKASKRVREGLLSKREEIRRQELAQAKGLGNYHPTIKQVFESPKGTSSKKRDRGLRMGVGKFSGGRLKLGRKDIIMAESGRQDLIGLRGSHGRRQSREWKR